MEIVLDPLSSPFKCRCLESGFFIAYSTLSCLERGAVGNLQVYNLYKLVEKLDIETSLIFKEIDEASQAKVRLIGKISSLKDEEVKMVLEVLGRVV